MKTYMQSIFQIDDIIITLSCDLLCILEYLIFLLDIVYRLQGLIFRLTDMYLSQIYTKHRC